MKRPHVELEIKSWHSPDVDLPGWSPARSSEVKFLLEIEIGQKDHPSRDLFHVVVATPEGLRHYGRGKQLLAERATLVLAEYSWTILRSSVEAIVKRCQSATWEESLLKLQRYFAWEYEDYVLTK